MRRTAAALALLVTLVSRSSAEDAPIGWKLQRGETLTYRLENTYKLWPNSRPDGVDSGGNDVDRNRTGSGKFEEKFTLKLEVDDVSTEGDATVTVSFPRVSAHVRMDDTGEEAEWDSQPGKPPVEFGFGPYEFLAKNTWKATIKVNGELAGLQGKNDYLLPGKTKKRVAKGDLSRAEKASELMPMPLPIEFWLQQIFSTIPADGKSKTFKRRLTELQEIGNDYAAEFDSWAEQDGQNCAYYRFEKKDLRIEEKKAGHAPVDFSTGDFRDGDNVKTTLASVRRTIRAYFSTKEGVMMKVEGEARDARMQVGTVARSQDWSCVLEKRKAAK
ncbi:MAG: hypothetical protein K8T20_14400 [Planctomycetes bacterium]|nr:hypothetical protein [Planctomycetota bacterium]